MLGVATDQLEGVEALVMEAVSSGPTVSDVGSYNTLLKAMRSGVMWTEP